MKEYNQKIDYLICKNLIDLNEKTIDELKMRKIYQEEKEAKTKKEIIMIRAKKIIDYIKRPTTEFTLKEIKKCYEMLVDKEAKITKSTQRLLKNIEEDFSINKVSDIAEKSIIEILKSRAFGNKWNGCMAKIVHNFILLKKDLVPVILYPSQMKMIRKLINEGEEAGAIVELKKAYERTNRFNIKHIIIPYEEIQEKIKNKKEELKERYGVESVYVYGSYARGEENEYSDLDLYVEISKQKRTEEVKKVRIANYIEKEIGLAIDIKIVKELNKTKGKEKKII